MKKALLTIAAVATLSTSAQAMDAVATAKMKSWVEKATPILMMADACNSPKYIEAYEVSYKVAHMAAQVAPGDMWSDIIDMEFTIAPMHVSPDIRKMTNLVERKANGWKKWCNDFETTHLTKFIESLK